MLSRSLIALVAALVAGFPAAEARVPVVGCERRAEPAGPEPTPDRWILTGPMAWARVTGAQRIGGRGSFVGKRGVQVEAGGAVTVRVLTRDAGVIYRHRTRLAETAAQADRVLRFRPCDPETAMFSGPGTVGPRTGFAGAIISDRRACVRIRVSRDGRSWTARIPVGRRCG